jgi:hypothetical protein
MSEPEHNPAPNLGDISKLLSTRGKTHGDFLDQATATQQLKLVQKVQQKTPLSFIQQEALDMIFHKIGRIITGDPDFRDHWDDIAGYAKLAADRCTK